MTISAVGLLTAVLIFVIGVAGAIRFDDRRREAIIVVALALAVALGWFSWLAGTSA